MLKQQTMGNYERIRTWRGAYTVQAQQYLSKGFVKANLGMMTRPEAPEEGSRVSALVQEFNHVQLFAIDIPSGSVYRAKESVNLRWMEEGKERKMLGSSPVEERSVVTSEHYLHFSPKVVWPGFEAVIGFPKAQDKRAAFRDPPEKARKQHRGELMDPRLFFGTNSVLKFWEKLSLLAQALRAQRPVNLAVYEVVGPGNPCYQLVEELNAAGGRSKIHVVSIWDSEAGFNPVSLVLSRDVSGKQPLTIRKWQWRQFDAVYIPAKVDEALYHPKSGRITYHREVKLKECAVNDPLDPQQFSYHGLGLQDDDLVMDRIENVCYVMEGRKLVKVADFNDEYKPPGQFGSSFRRWVLAGGSVVLLAVVLVVLWRKRSKG